MYFSDTFIERIREHFKLSDIISKRIKLNRKGNEFLGLCPFHSEKTPSFTVNDEKNFYHCFGCGAHGDVIKFVSHTANMNFTETIKYLAEEAGFPIEESRQQLAHQDSINELYKVMRLASNYFQQQLFSSSGAKALAYLERRNISNVFIKKFLLGYAPLESSKLREFLVKYGVSDELIVKTGLMAQGRNKELYSRLRNRLIFPIADFKDRIIGFGGRTMTAELMPKYLNSPETYLFKKSEVLYGLNFAKEEAYKRNSIILVEGYMDLITMHIAGLNNTVASLGTAITKEHITTLWKYSQTPIICLDGDDAGRRAMLRATENIMPILKPGYSVDFILLNSGKDPDELINTYGKEAMLRALESNITLSDFLWQESVRELPEKIIPEHRASLEASLEGIVRKINDVTVANHYRHYFKNKLWEYFHKSINKFQMKTLKDKEQINRIKLVTTHDLDPIQLLQQLLSNMIINYPELLNNEEIKEEFLALEFLDQKLDNLRMVILNDIENIEEDVRLIDYLEKQGYNAEINFLYRHNDAINCIINKFNSSIDAWNYNIKKYHVALLEKEYQMALKCMTEDSVSIAAALKTQIMSAKKHLNQMEKSLQYDY